jgi:hypothetical protein
MTDRPVCGSPLRGRPGKTCGQFAGQSTNHPGEGRCWLHGGRGNAEVKAEQEQAMVRLVADMNKLGIDTPIDPAVAVLEEIARANGHVIYLRGELQKLPDGDALVKGVLSVTQRKGVAMTPSGRLEPVDETTTVVGPGVHVLWKLYCAERDRLSKLALAALAAGVAERQIRLAEQQGALVGRLVVAMLGDLNLTEEQRGLVPGVIRRHLSAV